MLRISAWHKTLIHKSHGKPPPFPQALSSPQNPVIPKRYFHLSRSTRYGGSVRISHGIATPKASLKGLLTALAVLVTSATGYVFVQTQLFHENVFFPLYITPKARHPVGKFVPSSTLSTLIDSNQIILRETACDDLTNDLSVREHLLAQLYKRLAVDETVSSVVGMPVTRLKDFDELDVRVVAKRYWVVGIQFLSPVSALATDNSSENSASSSPTTDSHQYKFVFRKQARVLHTDSIASFFRSAFGRDPMGANEDEDDGKKGGQASQELNTIIQLEGDAPQNVGEIGPRPGTKRRPNGRRVEEDDDDDSKEDDTGNGDHSGKNGKKKDKKNLEDLIPHKNQIQMVASGSVTIHGPGGIHRHKHSNQNHGANDENYDGYVPQKHSFLYDQVIIKGTRTNLRDEDENEDEENEITTEDQGGITTTRIGLTNTELDEAVTEAKLEFVATKSLMPNEVGVRFLYTALVYTDPQTGESVRQRLW